MSAGEHYPGGKGQPGVWRLHINQIPPHGTLIVPFGGHCAVTRQIRPARRTVILDRDPDVVAWWRARERPGTVVIHGCGIEYLRAYEWRGDEFVYADPPYLRELRGDQVRELYRFPLGERREHKRLLAVLRQVPCPALVCGYYSPMYDGELAGWRTLDYRQLTRGGRLAHEWLWLNYPPPRELHDYRFLGEGYRQRQDVRRMQARWRARFAQLTPLQRFAMLSVLAEEHQQQVATLGSSAEVVDRDGDQVERVG